MDTRVDEIGAGIYRISVFVPTMPPSGFTYNHFLVVDDEPLLFHCGKRKMFPLVSAAVARVLPPETLRWLSFGHFEADECGAMNEWLATAPNATLAHGTLGCRVSIEDMADRPPRTLADGAVIETGRRRFRYIDTPHLPHGWDAGVLFEETTQTLFCGDLFAHFGNTAPSTQSDIVGPATHGGHALQSTSLGPTTGPNIRKLARLEPKLLAVMHGASFEGDGGAALTDLATYFEDSLRAALSVGVDPALHHPHEA
jgi:flavorubredoxin